MRVLIDECLPVRLAGMLAGHEIRTVRDLKLLGLGNGKLLAAAEPLIDVFVTVDKNLVNQHTIPGLRLSVIVLRARSNKIEDLSPLLPRLLSALDALSPGQVVLVG